MHTLQNQATRQSGDADLGEVTYISIIISILRECLRLNNMISWLDSMSDSSRKATVDSILLCYICTYHIFFTIIIAVSCIIIIIITISSLCHHHCVIIIIIVIVVVVFVIIVNLEIYIDININITLW